MDKYEVECEIVIATSVTLVVEAEDKEGAVEAALALLPSSGIGTGPVKWSPAVSLTPPEGVEMVKCKPVGVNRLSGGEKAKKLKK